MHVCGLFTLDMYAEACWGRAWRFMRIETETLVSAGFLRRSSKEMRETGNGRGDLGITKGVSYTATLARSFLLVEVILYLLLPALAVHVTQIAVPPCSTN